MEKVAENTAKPKKKGFVKRLIGFILGVVVLIVANVLPATGELTHEGIMALGILLFAIIFWFCDTLPAGVTGLLGAILLAVFGVVEDFATAWSGFTASTVWFIFGIFVMTALMIKTSLGRRLVSALVSKAGTKAKSVVLAYMIATAIVSMFMTDTGAVAVGMSLALPFLNAINAKEKKKNLGRCLAIGIASAAIIGGFITPFGHSLNILCAGLLTSTYGLTISFFEWFIPGLIIAIIMIPALWIVICKVFPPEALTEEEAQFIVAKDDSKMDSRDIKALIYMIVLVAGFICGNWITILSNVNVIMIMLAVAFLPGVDLLTWKDFQEAEGWGVVLMVGGVMCMANAASSTGAAAYMVNLFLNCGIMNLPILLSLILIMAVAYLIHTFVPAAPALCALFVPPVMGLCVSAGISPAIFAMLMGSVTAGSFLMPFSPPMMVSYSEGYYTTTELAKSGWLTSIIYVLVEVLVLYFIGGLLLPLA
jgi:solute carrier family 13 (sodium-dependent dicarboxylate transporter), member 2/3/5